MPPPPLKCPHPPLLNIESSYGPAESNPISHYNYFFCKISSLNWLALHNVLRPLSFSVCCRDCEATLRLGGGGGGHNTLFLTNSL